MPQVWTVFRPEDDDCGRTGAMVYHLRPLRIQGWSIPEPIGRDGEVEPCEGGLNIQYAASVTMN